MRPFFAADRSMQRFSEADQSIRSFSAGDRAMRRLPSTDRSMRWFSPTDRSMRRFPATDRSMCRFSISSLDRSAIENRYTVRGMNRSVQHVLVSCCRLDCASIFYSRSVHISICCNLPVNAWAQHLWIFSDTMCIEKWLASNNIYPNNNQTEFTNR